MADVEKLRSLLAEARQQIDGWAPSWSTPADDLIQRTDAALAEPVTVIDWKSFFKKAEQERDEALALVQNLSGAWQSEQLSSLITDMTLSLALKQRDEARAEVEGLREAVNAWAKTAAWNYRRGAETMREAAAREVFAFYAWSKDNEATRTDIKNLAEMIDALPVPEDKP